MESRAVVGSQGSGVRCGMKQLSKKKSAGRLREAKDLMHTCLGRSPWMGRPQVREANGLMHTSPGQRPGYGARNEWQAEGLLHTLARRAYAAGLQPAMRGGLCSQGGAAALALGCLPWASMHEAVDLQTRASNTR